MIQQTKSTKSSVPDSAQELAPSVESLQKMLDDYQHENTRQQEHFKKIEANWQQENHLLREQISLLKQELYGRRSEKCIMDDAFKQKFLFEENPETTFEGEDCESVKIITVPEHKRKKKKGRKPLPVDLPRVEEYHDIAESEKVCDCGCRMKEMGEERSEKLEMLPALFWVLCIIRPKYACPKCQGLESEKPTVTLASVPAQILPKSIASPSLLSHIFVSKFADSLPFYRQERQFARHGIELSRGTMCRWAFQVSEKLKSLSGFLKSSLLSGPLIGVDETTVQVLKEPGRKASSNSYMWVFHGGPPGGKIVIFHYSKTRSGRVARDFLGNYKGHVQTDGYVGYDFLDTVDDIIHSGCWAHARRKFVDVVKAFNANKRQTAGMGKCGHAMQQINRLYRIERKAKETGLSYEELYSLRQKEAKPILQEFREWLKENATTIPPTTLLGQAFAYTIRQWPRLINYLESGHVHIDNNFTENAIRPFVVGRKNWLFSDQPEGAQASALFYSLIETAKANGLEPHSYLLYLLEQLPHAITEDDKKALLPIYLKQTTLERNKKDYWLRKKAPQ